MRWISCLICILVFAGCGNSPKGPDVSGISVNLTLSRFEKDLFSLDSNKTITDLDPLIAKYKGFGENFMVAILNADPRWSNDTIAAYVNSFMSSHRSVYDTAMIVFKDFSPYEDEIKKGLQHVKFYFPSYTLPKQIITYIGPLDGYGDILSEDALIVGLHHHLGARFSLYRSEWVALTYPEYLTRRFTPSTISVNAMANIVNDIYPEKEEDKSLVMQMIQRGKRLYIMSKLLPEKEEYELIGYTKKQMDDCYAHEAQIWNLFIQNNLLRTIDNNIIKNYVGESPKTQELGEASPGNIGSFAGWQIVKKYMSANSSLGLDELIKKDEEEIFQASKYKP